MLGSLYSEDVGHFIGEGVVFVLDNDGLLDPLDEFLQDLEQDGVVVECFLQLQHHQCGNALDLFLHQLVLFQLELRNGCLIFRFAFHQLK